MYARALMYALRARPCLHPLIPEALVSLAGASEEFGTSGESETGLCF
jgi:hypothetical protein